MRALAVATLIGCYSPAAPSGVPCVNGACPSGQACIDNVCTVEGDPDPQDDAPPPPDACETCTPEDTDGDGVLDADDNCVMKSNADQVNEDNDVFGDACDPCPPFNDNTDDDGDGVGNRCDPRPNLPGDAIVHFLGFEAPIPNSWSSSGTITLDQGDASASATGAPGSVLTIASPPGTHHVVALVTLDQFDLLALAGVGVIARHVPGSGGTDALACQLVGAVGGLMQRLRLFDTTANMTLAEATHELMINTPYLLWLRRDGSRYDCLATQPTVAISTMSAITPSSDEVGFRIRSAQVRFHWLMVVTE